MIRRDFWAGSDEGPGARFGAGAVSGVGTAALAWAEGMSHPVGVGSGHSASGSGADGPGADGSGGVSVSGTSGPGAGSVVGPPWAVRRGLF